MYIGAFGTVYRAELWGQVVAVKELLTEKITPAVMKEFHDEAEILKYVTYFIPHLSTHCIALSMNSSFSSLRHPNVGQSWALDSVICANMDSLTS